MVVVVCRSHQQAAGALVSIGERGGQADRGLLQPAPPELLPTIWTLLWNGEAEDLLLTVAQTDDAVLHCLLWVCLLFLLLLFSFTPLRPPHLVTAYQMTSLPMTLAYQVLLCQQGSHVT